MTPITTDNGKLMINLVRLIPITILCAYLALPTTSFGDDTKSSSLSGVPNNIMSTIVESIKDSAGRTVKEVDADGRVMTYVYKEDGTISARIGPDGQRISESHH